MTKPVIRVKAGDATGATARPSASVGMRAAHNAADYGHPMMMGWVPPMRSADADWLPERDISTARLRDMERNEGWVTSGIDRLVDMLVGASLRLNPTPDHNALGISFEEAHQYGKRIQAAWRRWANDPTFRCDAERQLPFVGLAGLAAREFVGAPGESFSVLRWIERPGWAFRTAVQIIDPDRVTNPNGMPDSATLRRGVEKDENGAPVAYHFRRAHPSDVSYASLDAMIWDRIPRWDDIDGWERPKVLHLYDKRRPGQSRGISKLVAGLTKIRGVSRVAESEIRAYAINASIIGALYTQMGAEYAADRLGAGGSSDTDWGSFIQQRADFYSKRTSLDYEKFLTLFPSDKLELNTQPRETSGYPAFQTAFLQAFASGLGISYEQLSMDWSKTNYSSARAALNEVWRGVQRLRGVLIWSFALPLYAAWLEDAIDSGEVEMPSGAPDFYDDPAAHLHSDWIGPGRGYVDPVKESQASTNRVKGMISNLQRENAEQGMDYEDNLDQLAREMLQRRERNLPEPGADMEVVARTDLEDRRPDSN